jgi:hypothetical protein
MLTEPESASKVRTASSVKPSSRAPAE